MSDNSNLLVLRVRHQLIGAARDAYPDEACGVITFSGLVWTARNLNDRVSKWAKNQGPDFIMNPEDVLVMWPHAAALWHTHPSGRLDPSTVDVHWHPTRGATWKPLGMVIVTCEDVRVAIPWPTTA